jgi:hypothetical protein
MFDGISHERILTMTPQELRWLHNLKKAFLESDHSFISDRKKDHCLPEILKAIDTAKTLRRSLRGEPLSNYGNKRLFIEFLELEIPSAQGGGLSVSLKNPRTGKTDTYGFASLVYSIRCMVHENENLDAREVPEYHVLLDWQDRSQAVLYFVNECLVCNGEFIWERLRQVLAKFITYIDSVFEFERSGRFRVLINPPLGSIQPDTQWSI